MGDEVSALEPATRSRLLPRGLELPHDVWERRHSIIVWIVWAHAVLLFVFGLLRGFSFEHMLLEAGVIAVLAAAGTWIRARRNVRAAIATTGIVSSSAVLVHLSGGYIEMHFHFFVMVGLIAIYQSWVPFLLAIAYVVLHHGTVGVIDPRSVYNHPAAWENPWGWAAIHGAFILAMSIVSLGAWRVSEDAHERAELYSRRLFEHSLKRRQALMINDNVVQGLAVAKYALDLGEQAKAEEAVEDTLASARAIMSQLLDEAGDNLPGAIDLRRTSAATIGTTEDEPAAATAATPASESAPPARKPR